MKINSLQKKYLSLLCDKQLSPKEWQDLEKRASPYALMHHLLASPHQARQVAIPQAFSLFFTRHFGYVLHPQQLELFDWFYHGLKMGVVQERQLLATRRMGKSDIVSIAAVAWKLLHEPTFKFIIVSKAQSTLNVINHKIRKILSEYGVLSRATQQLISVKGAHKDGDKSFSIMFLTQGSNKRGLRANHIIMDDLLDASDASLAVREQTFLTYQECRSIVPSTTFISQLAHEEDLAQQLRDREDVETKEIWLADLSPELSMAIGLLDIQQIEAQYAKRYIGHNFTGHHYKDSTIQYFSDLKIGDFVANHMIWAFIDPSFGGGDKTGITLLSVVEETIFAHVQESDYDLSHLPDVLAMLTKLHADGAQWVVVETNNGGDMLFKLPQVYDLVQGLGMSLDGVRNSRSKVDRIMALYPYRQRLVISGCVHAVRTWERDVSTNSPGKRRAHQHDDGIDSLAMGVLYLDNKGLLMMRKEARHEALG